MRSVLEIRLVASHRQVVLDGVSELAEIAAVRSFDMPLSCVGTFDPAARTRLYPGRPLWSAEALMPGCDAVVLISLALAAEFHSVFAASRPGAPLLVLAIVLPLIADAGTTGGGRC